MVRTRTWTVEITVVEHEDGRRTPAQVVLRPSGQALAEFGDEVGTAQALADLAYRVVDGAAAAPAPFTHRPLRMLS
jgi:hypothetical protein